MSESVTTAQIEDVLSSIRRLVSEDGRSDPRGEQLHETGGDAVAAGGDPVAKPVVERSGRLVLTPALRVSAPAEPPVGEPFAGESFSDEPSAEPAESRVDAAAVTPQDSRTPWSDPSTPLFASPREPMPEVEVSDDTPEGMEAAPELAVSDHAETMAEAQAADSQSPDFAPQDAPDDSEQAPMSEETLTFHSARAESLSAKIEALEAVIGRTRDQWEPDGPSSDSYAGTPVRPIGWREVEAGDAEHAGAVSGGDEAAMSTAQHAPEAPSEGPSSEAVDALAAETLSEAFDVEDQTGGEEAAAELPSDEPSSDEQGAGEQAVEDQTVEDQPIEDWAVEDVIPEDSPADDMVADDSTADDLAIDDLDDDDPLSDESVIDEDSLRELVAEIVRQELQGALGERITRNVRKLVRREIHRALAAQDLD